MCRIWKSFSNFLQLRLIGSLLRSIQFHVQLSFILTVSAMRTSQHYCVTFIKELPMVATIKPLVSQFPIPFVLQAWILSADNIPTSCYYGSNYLFLTLPLIQTWWPLLWNCACTPHTKDSAVKMSENLLANEDIWEAFAVFTHPHETMLSPNDLWK